MPASTKIADDDVHNHPGVNQIPDDDVHNLPTQSSDPDDPTPVVNTSGLNSVNTQPFDLSSVPEYERDVARSESLEKGSLGDTTAHVTGPYNGPTGGPNHVTVDMPEAFTTAVQAHELQHTIQYKNTPILDDVKNILSQKSSLAQTKPTSYAGGNDDSEYDYGGTEGLEKHIASGKTIADLTSEQQASIPQNYMKEYTNAVKAGDAKAVDHLNKVYGPAIKQLRNMANPSKTTINTTPDAPAGAPAELLGSAKPVEGMASKSTKSARVKTWNKDAASALGRK